MKSWKAISGYFAALYFLNRFFMILIVLMFGIINRPGICFSDRLPDARVGEPYEYGVVVEGLTEPLSFDWSYEGDKSDWVKFSGPVIRGIPNAIRMKMAYQLHLEVKDALNKSLTADYELLVRPSIQPLRIVTKQIPLFVVNRLSYFEIAASGGEGKYKWTCEASSLPDGLTVTLGEERQQCILKGSPKQAGRFQIKVSVSDTLNKKAEKELKGHVIFPPSPDLKIITASLPIATYKAPYFATLCVIGGYPPYTWEITKGKEEFPSWLGFDSNKSALAGTPDEIGTYVLSVQAKDNLGSVAKSKELRLKVKALPSVLRLFPDQLPSAIVGRPYAAAIFVTGTQGCPRWEIVREPGSEWLKIEEEKNCLFLRGIPSGYNGTLKLDVTVHDIASTSPSLNTNDIISSIGPTGYSINIKKFDPVRLLTGNMHYALLSFPFKLQLAGSGGYGQLKYHVSIDNAKWLRSSEDGLLEGTPDEVGEYTVKVHDMDRDNSKNRSKTSLIKVKAIDPSNGVLRILDFPEIIIPEGHEVSFQLPVVGGVPPYQGILISDLPPGIRFDTSTLILSGVPTKKGEFSSKFKIYDSSMDPQSIGQEVLMKIISDKMANMME